jgi:hypothetical protein
MKKIIIALCTFSIGCASTHPGNLAKKVEGGIDDLVISAHVDSEYSDKNNLVIDFAVENQGPRWIRIDKVDIDFSNKDHVIHNIIVGDDLKIWAESYANKKRRDDHNADLGLATAVLGGMTVAILASGGGNESLSSAALASAGAGLLAGDVRKLKKDQRTAQNTIMVPENYMLAPITVPSQGFLRRWLLINLPQSLVAKTATMTLRTIEGQTLKYEVPIQMQ